MGGFVPLLQHLLQWFQMGCTNMLLRKRRELCASAKEYVWIATKYGSDCVLCTTGPTVYASCHS